MGFSDSSVANESACNVGEPSLIPRSGRSSGKGMGYPLRYSWVSLVAQLVKNLPAMQETWVWPGFDLSLTWVGKIPWKRERLLTPVSWPGKSHGLYSLWGPKQTDTNEWLSLSKKLITVMLELFSVVETLQQMWNLSSCEGLKG